MFWFIVLLLLVGGGFYVYSKLREMERQIRAEQEQEKQRVQQQSVPVTETTDPTPLQEASPMATPPTVAAESTDADSNQQRILAAVQRQPGILQSELYSLLPAMSKRQQQQLIKQLADDGKLERKSCRGSYQLYSA